MNNQPFLKTDKDVKLELHKQKKPTKHLDEINVQQLLSQEVSQMNTGLIAPRYGTTVDLKSNKIVDQSDKYLTRDRNLKTEKTNIKKYRISRINVDSRYRNKDPKNIIGKFNFIFRTRFKLCST